MLITCVCMSIYIMFRRHFEAVLKYITVTYLVIKYFLWLWNITLFTKRTNPPSSTSSVTSTIHLGTWSIVNTVTNTSMFTMMTVPSMSTTFITITSYLVTRKIVFAVSRTLVFTIKAVPIIWTFCSYIKKIVFMRVHKILFWYKNERYITIYLPRKIIFP